MVMDALTIVRLSQVGTVQEVQIQQQMFALKFVEIQEGFFKLAMMETQLVVMVAQRHVL